MDPTEDLGLHPRLAQAHADFHGSHAYRQVIQMVDSGSIAAAIPPVYRSSLKTMIEQLLVQFHDLGLAAGLRGESDPLQALQEAETKQAQILRQRLEGALGRIQEDLRRHFRDAETKWKKADPRDDAKTQLAAQMNRYRQEASRVMSLDKGTLIAKVHAMAGEAFGEGFHYGQRLHLANQRKRRLGLPVDEIPIPVAGHAADDEFYG